MSLYNQLVARRSRPRRLNNLDVPGSGSKVGRSDYSGLAVCMALAAMPDVGRMAALTSLNLDDGMIGNVSQKPYIPERTTTGER